MGDGSRGRRTLVPIPCGLEVLGHDGGGEDRRPQRLAELRLQREGWGEVDVLGLCCAQNLQDREEGDPVALTNVLPGEVLDPPGGAVPAMNEWLVG